MVGIEGRGKVKAAIRCRQDDKGPFLQTGQMFETDGLGGGVEWAQSPRKRRYGRREELLGSFSPSENVWKERRPGTEKGERGGNTSRVSWVRRRRKNIGERKPRTWCGAH